MFDLLSWVPGILFGRKTPATTPFDKPSSDCLTLRTTNGSEFHVSKITLREASLYFRDMFTIPQAHASPTDTPEQLLASQTVDVPEHSRVWESLLKFLLPVRPPALCRAEEIVSLMEAATKYKMPHVHSLLRHQLAVKAIDDPLKVYALAARLGWMAEMRIAARAYLLQEVPENQEEFVREMEGISVGAYGRLQKYRTECNAAVTRLFSVACPSSTGNNGQSSPSYECLCVHTTDRPWFKNLNPKGPGFSKVVVRTWVPGGRRQSVTVWAQQWWVECMLRAVEKLKSRPHDGIMTSEFFADFLFEGATSQPYQKKLLMPAVSQFQREFLSAVKEAVDDVKLEVSAPPSG